MGLFGELVITHIFIRSAYIVSQPANAGARVEPGVERSGTAGIWRSQLHQARGAGGSFLLFTISSSLRLGRSLPPASRAVTINLCSYLGFRCAPPQALF